MTDAEIKKALEICMGKRPHEDCEDCPNYESESHCKVMLSEVALDLINRQQAMIERLKDENLQSEYPARIRVDDFFVCANSLGEWLEFCDSLKAEAIKEFADLAIKTIRKNVTPIPQQKYLVERCIQNIDNLVKEMVGDAV